MFLTSIYSLNQKEKEIENKDKDSKIVMGAHHSSLLIKERRLFTWGFNSDCQLGDEKKDKNTPTDITDNFVDEVEKMNNLYKRICKYN